MNIRKEEGFTTAELMIVIALTTVGMIVFFTLMGDTSRVSMITKETHFAEELIDSYVRYYEEVEVTGESVEVFLEGTNEVDLVSNFKDEGGLVPKGMKDLKVICRDYISINSSNDILTFELDCSVNGRSINGSGKFNSGAEKAYKVKRFIER